MQELANERYKAPSGNDVTLEIDFIPWPLYYERLAASLTSGEQKYQMVVSDSQWLGAFVEGGYYMKINEFIDADPELQAVFDDLHPNLVAAYSSYPYGSEDYYGFPQNPEFLIVFYRKDLFCDDGERAAFAAKYGYTLPCTPEEMNDVDWDMVRDFGEFFRRARVNSWPGKPSTTTSMALPTRLPKLRRRHHADQRLHLAARREHLGREQGAERAGRGRGQFTAAVEALEHYLSLLEYMPPVVKTGTMDPMKVHELFNQGKVAWIIVYITLAETTIDPGPPRSPTRPDSPCTPGRVRRTAASSDGPTSPASRSSSPPGTMTRPIREMLDFVKWWLSEETQIEFAKRGVQSGRRSVYSRPEYIGYRPWNHTFAPSLDWQRDLWHVPTFFELLVQAQEEYNKAITGQQSARETMDNIAAFQQHLTEEGLIE